MLKSLNSLKRLYFKPSSNDSLKATLREQNYKERLARLITANLNEKWSARQNRFQLDAVKGYSKTSELPLIVFIHIPKTAGSSFARTLHKNYKGGALYEIPSEQLHDREALQSSLNERLENLQAVTGHSSFYLRIDQLLKRECCFVTILREPVDRLVSLYYYLRSIADANPIGKQIVERNMSLVDFAQSRFDLTTDNPMLRMLTGSDTNSITWGACTQEMLENAKHNLLHYFDFVGFTDEYSEFLPFVSKQFGWNTEEEKLNINADRKSLQEVDPDTIRVIEELNSFDVELYRYAKSIFSLKKNA
jgi:hypothetical protein